MSLIRFRRPLFGVVVLFAAILSWFSGTDDEALARGVTHGLHWGYQPPAGNPLTNLWLVASPWSALSGGGIPHHSLGPSNLNQAYGPGGRQTRSSTGMLVGQSTYGTVGSGYSSPQSNRSAIFPGASSQMSSSTYSRPAGGGYSPTYYSAPTYYAAPTDGSPRTEKVYQPAYFRNYNEYWHHGYWGGGQMGWAHWDQEMGRFCFPRWGIGPLYYDSGYGTYQNPFVAGEERLAPYAVVIDLDAQGNADANAAAGDESRQLAQNRVLKSPEVTAGLKAFDAAREAFRNRDFATALRKVDESLESLPNDPALQEFRGLVLFAQGEYRQAAAVIYAVLAVSPGWDWTTLGSMYADQDEYTKQLRKLETYRKQNTESPEAAFLVAYHYATCGHHEVAVKHLRNVVKLLPDDRLTPHLATLLAEADAKRSSDKAPGDAAAAPDAAVPKPAEEKPAPFDGSKLTGTWHASRGTNLRFELTLEEDTKFAWVVEGAGPARARIEGNYLWSGNYLLLSSGDGMMIGVVTPKSLGGSFNFRLLENAPSEPGLDFDK